HPDVFNILLQILEDGILTDAQGRRVDFKNTVIIMTSNAGVTDLANAPRKLGFAVDEESAVRDEREKTRAALLEALKRTFKPEFLNRVDETIVFNKLTDADIEKITEIMLGEVKKRITALDISIEFSHDVVASLAKEGFDPAYGARPLRRAIVRRVEDSFSEAMLRGDIKAGDRVTAVLEDGVIRYRSAEPAAV
ncbi:MAG: ATP-dependent Clp protease ATP-binding subunit, partial [Clostridia bacterium]|nr:ATP-dependent Clp protease ATP-binding subunit [Clostridia bacterium]